MYKRVSSYYHFLGFVASGYYQYSVEVAARGNALSFALGDGAAAEVGDGNHSITAAIACDALYCGGDVAEGHPGDLVNGEGSCRAVLHRYYHFALSVLNVADGRNLKFAVSSGCRDLDARNLVGEALCARHCREQCRC